MKTMNGDLSELIEYLDEKFSKIDQDIADLKSGTQALRMEVIKNREGIKNVEEKMATKVEVNKLLDAVDAYMKQGEDYRQEMVMLSHKVDRHEKWILQLAEKLGLKLEY